MSLLNENIELFPVNYGWFNHKTFRHIPRKINPESRKRLALLFLQNDEIVREAISKCNDTWIMAVTLGKDTISVNFYDPAVIAEEKGYSTSETKEADIFRISKEGDILPISQVAAQKAIKSKAFLYSFRRLTPTEVEELDQKQRSFEVFISEPLNNLFPQSA